MKICDMNTYMKNQDGGVLVVTLLIVSSIMVISVSLVAVLSGLYRQASTNDSSTKAFYLAQAGIEKAIVEYLLLDSNKDLSDNEHQELFKNVRFGDGKFSVRSKESRKNRIILKATGESRASRKSIEVLVQINFDTVPATASILKWNEQIVDSLSFSF